MCGIIAAASNRNVGKLLVQGLHKMEYRGYDSAGIALHQDDGIAHLRTLGKVQLLEEKMIAEKPKSKLGIAHTRWATHGEPSEINAHPHKSSDSVYIVHNGIIENYVELREDLKQDGYEFLSQTDSELIAHLLDFYINQGQSMIDAMYSAKEKLEGAYAIAAIDIKDSTNLVIARNKSPLLIGIGTDEMFAASDPLAIAQQTNDFIFLEDGDVAVIDKSGIDISRLEGGSSTTSMTVIEDEWGEADMAGYPHFMLKEIHEQPEALRRCITGRLDKSNGSAKLGGLKLEPIRLRTSPHVRLIGCGTALNACKIGHLAIESLARIPATSHVASEFRYNDPVINPNAIHFAVSQSGETADTYAALDICNKNSMKTCAVVNVIESSIARDSNFVLPIHCGPEIGVASTKAFLGQILVLYILALKLGSLRNEIEKNEYKEKIKDLKDLPELIEKTLLHDNDIQAISSTFNEAKGSMFLGRGYSYPIALEGALKLKELSYVHAEGYPAGEMKHGPLALIEEGMPVVVLAPRDNYYKKTISNMQEVIARGAKVLLITNKSKDEVVSENIWETIEVENTNDDLLPFLLTIPLQKLAYYSALKKGYDIDKPRNLAKSVTVE